MYRQSEKNANSNICSICPHNMANIGPLTAEIGLPVMGTPAHFSGYWLRYCSNIGHQRPTKLCTMFGHLLGCYNIYIFRGSCTLAEFCQVQNSLYVQVLRSAILAELLHGTRAVAVSQTSWRGRGNGITELSERAPPLFGWAAITLGIGQHSSCCYCLTTSPILHM